MAAASTRSPAVVILRLLAVPATKRRERGQDIGQRRALSIPLDVQRLAHGIDVRPLDSLPEAVLRRGGGGGEVYGYIGGRDLGSVDPVALALKPVRGQADPIALGHDLGPIDGEALRE